jgi:hypothetical protein
MWIDSFVGYLTTLQLFCIRYHPQDLNQSGVVWGTAPRRVTLHGNGSDDEDEATIDSHLTFLLLRYEPNAS